MPGAFNRLRGRVPLVAIGIAASLMAPAGAGQIDADALIAQARTTYPGDLCWWDRVEDDAGQIAAHEITFRYAYEAEDGPDRTVTVYEMPCFYGAYNFGTIWFIDTEFEGLVPLHFAQPVVDVTYSDDTDTAVETIRIAGFKSAPTVVNSSYDEDSKTITGFSKWRGLGDAASTGVWAFREGEFVLTRFEVDATYDGEINPVVVYDAPQN